jgi:hypothetical protein
LLVGPAVPVQRSALCRSQKLFKFIIAICIYFWASFESPIMRKGRLPFSRAFLRVCFISGSTHSPAGGPSTSFKGFIVSDPCGSWLIAHTFSVPRSVMRRFCCGRAIYQIFRRRPLFKKPYEFSYVQKTERRFEAQTSEASSWKAMACVTGWRVGTQGG